MKTSRRSTTVVGDNVGMDGKSGFYGSNRGSGSAAAAVVVGNTGWTPVRRKLRRWADENRIASDRSNARTPSGPSVFYSVFHSRLSTCFAMLVTSSGGMCWYRVVIDICDQPMSSMTARVGTPSTSSMVAAV